MSRTIAKKGAPQAAPQATSRRTAAKVDAVVAETAKAPARAPKNIISAGIKALTSAHEEAVARQSRVFESLLGLGHRREAEAPPANEAATSLDPFGFKKFEDVFDQRVARAMQHLGVPTHDDFATLEAEVERLRAEVARLEAQGRKR